MRLLLENTMALVVDYQERPMPVIYEMKHLHSAALYYLRAKRWAFLW